PSHPSPLPLSLRDALPISAGHTPPALARSLTLRSGTEAGPFHQRDEHGKSAIPRGTRRDPADAAVLRRQPVHVAAHPQAHRERRDRKSTRLNSSHVKISYA